MHKFVPTFDVRLLLPNVAPVGGNKLLSISPMHQIQVNEIPVIEIFALIGRSTPSNLEDLSQDSNERSPHNLSHPRKLE